jgi:holo-[acyl-carrier protein] synthase
MNRNSYFNIGVDCENISRFEKIKFKDNPSFYKKIFTAKEIKYCLSKKNPYPHFAVRFSAKEAIIKALPSSEKVLLNQVEILNDAGGKPFVNFKKDNFIFEEKDVRISLSHSKDLAVAFAIIFKRKP